MRPGARGRGSWPLFVGGTLIASLAAFSLLVPLLSPHDPYASDFVRGVGPDELPVGPTWRFPLGVDSIYRDELTRLAVAGRTSLLIGAGATTVAIALGTLVGVVSGYFEGRSDARVPILALALAGAAAWATSRSPALAVAVFSATLVATSMIVRRSRSRAAAAGPNVDSLLMRFVDAALAFPFLLLILAVGSAVDVTTPATVLVTLGLTGWLGVARVVRAKAMQIRDSGYVEAARALGQSDMRILVGHVLPNVATPVRALAALLVAQMILAESVLGYLGAGTPPPLPTWGHMLAEGQEAMVSAPWLLAAPAGALVVAVFGFNLLGEGLRRALEKASR